MSDKSEIDTLKTSAVAATLRYAAKALGVHPDAAEMLAGKLSKNLVLTPDGKFKSVVGGDLADELMSLKLTDPAAALCFADAQTPASKMKRGLSVEEMNKLTPSQLLDYANTVGK